MSTEASLGTHRIYPEEQPRLVTLADFDIDVSEVTNANFARFIEQTGYITTAERPQQGFGVPGGAVFKAPTPSNPSWWHFIEGASWQFPEGPENARAAHNHPVVQVSLLDARAYAAWVGRAIPTEDQWEHAAQGDATSRYPWGDNRQLQGRHQANTWQGVFPLTNSAEDGFLSRAPTGCFPPSAAGLYDMIGNVWEWTQSPVSVLSSAAIQTSVPSDEPARFIIKGGSYLCAENFCRRDRAAARQPQDANFSTNHIGFRTVSKP